MKARNPELCYSIVRFFAMQSQAKMALRRPVVKMPIGSCYSPAVFSLPRINHRLMQVVLKSAKLAILFLQISMMLESMQLGETETLVLSIIIVILLITLLVVKIKSGKRNF